MYTYLLDLDRAIGKEHKLFLLRSSSSCGKNRQFFRRTSYSSWYSAL